MLEKIKNINPVTKIFATAFTLFLIIGFCEHGLAFLQLLKVLTFFASFGIIGKISIFWAAQFISGL